MSTISNFSQARSIPAEDEVGNLRNLEVIHIPRVENGIQFFRGKCTVRVANQFELRQKAYKHMYDIYSKMGITKNNSNGLWLSIYDALPGTTTLVAENNKGEIEGALTLVFDSPIGLPADELYKKEIDGLRDEGRFSRARCCLDERPCSDRSARYLSGHGD